MSQQEAGNAVLAGETKKPYTLEGYGFAEAGVRTQGSVLGNPGCLGMRSIMHKPIRRPCSPIHATRNPWEASRTKVSFQRDSGGQVVMPRA